jgi:ferritin
MSMMSKTLVDAFNEQIQYEFASAYLYLGMAAYCESINLSGCASWLRAQWREEQGHAMRLSGHVTDRGGRVVLQGIDKPQAEYKSVHDVFQQVLSHEQKVTASVHQLYALSLKENDYAAQVELQWFIKEQVEEEKSAGDINAQLARIGDNSVSLLMLDRALSERKGD